MINSLTISVGIAPFDEQIGRFSYPGRAMLFYPDTEEERQALYEQLVVAVKAIQVAHLSTKRPKEPVERDGA